MERETRRLLSIYPFENVEVLVGSSLSMDKNKDYFFGHSNPAVRTLFHALLQSANKVPHSNPPTNHPPSLITYRHDLAPLQVNDRTQRMPPVLLSGPTPSEPLLSRVSAMSEISVRHRRQWLLKSTRRARKARRRSVKCVI